MLTSNVDSLAVKGAPHLADAVHTVIRGVNLANVLYQGSVTKTTGHLSPEPWIGGTHAS
ncbi:hypothetical protein [Corynebacterium diphtheriae]|uniref:hypothetical protein n=1 Tax=Corynebacterium diphtheriae TaxID=1717 RepID=UPI001EE67B6E|nr:hypothetical protein [Corynebacterium diphtheriae]